jgi:DNA helicase-2/ATP-dependent DNA helicase PcrA
MESLNLLGKSLCSLAYNGKGNHQNHYCPDAFEHVPWRMLLINILNSEQDIASFKNESEDQNWSQWCTSLKEYLEPYFENLPDTHSEWIEAKKKIRAPPGKGRELVTESFTTSTSTSNVRITTIHNIKGETLDAAMLISSPTRHSRGGHFEDWLEDISSEYARFAYVACSRPRHLLIVAVPPLLEEEKIKLESIGLVSEEMPGTLSDWL